MDDNMGHLVSIDKKDALMGKYQDKGIFSMIHIFCALQRSYYEKNEEHIKAFENVWEAYNKQENKDKIDLVYVSPNGDGWAFIES
jgi:hypothetical protein